MSMEKRIEALERSYGTETREEDPAEVARWREELKARLERADETEGNPRRRIALSELKESMKERIRLRTGGP